MSFEADNLSGESDNPDATTRSQNGHDGDQQSLCATVMDHATADPGAIQTSSLGIEEKVNDEVEIGQHDEESTLPPVLLAGATRLSRNSNSALENVDTNHSSPSSSAPASRAASRLGTLHVAPSFDRRFQTRISSAISATSSTSAAFLTRHSRQSSNASSESLAFRDQHNSISEEGNTRPWEVVRWSKLNRISSQTFSEATRRAFGRPTFLTVSALIAVGTSKGVILLFDYNQSLTAIIGQSTSAIECGAITSLAISADHSTIAAGHANGSIFTWDLSRPAKAFLHIPPIGESQAINRKSVGHVIGSAVLHIGFLGQRHTALVSADDNGMAFSHMASRGLGSVGRNVATTRILGRYPNSSKSQRPSSVLAFAPLPLGNVNQPTDEFGLTALLTPYLLVIVSTTPTAQTHFKLPRTRDIPPHSALTGCLSWFPAVRLKGVTTEDAEIASKTKLAYCWSNILGLLEIETSKNVDPTEPNTKSGLIFNQRGIWESDEAILTVQWMSRSIIAVLTITQRLIILTDSPLSVADSSDLNSKQIYHRDIFSRQLLPATENAGNGYPSLHGVVADAYYMSVKAYKGRLFLLGVNEVSLGTLSNWADRLVSLMEAGDPITAIELATSYYNGGADKVTLGLPNDERARHALVKSKILELLSASLKYHFNSEEHRNVESDMRSTLRKLARVTFAACISIQEVSFLFDEVYEWFSDSSVQDVFLFELEPYIIQHEIDTVPTTIIKDILVWYASHNLATRLESIICALQTDTMDIDQVSTVCIQLKLYDALISVWNRALDDYVTPLVHILTIAQTFRSDSKFDSLELEQRNNSALKVFPYMAYTLTGRRYPDGSDMPPRQSFNAKASLYEFIFADKTIELPHMNSRLTLLGSQSISELNYPYLRYLLRFDSFGFLSMLNEVFEDSFLNEPPYKSFSDADAEELVKQRSGTSITRQRIVNILLEVIVAPNFGFEETIYLDIFLARNLAKYAQFILLSGSALRQILVELCNNSTESLSEECQLSVEYLLSTYHPPDLLELVPLFAEAKFFRILKNTYRGSKQFAHWIEAHFKDPDNQESVFTSIGDCLRPGSGLSKRQIRDVKSVIQNHVNELVEIDVALAARCLVAYASDILEGALRSLEQDSQTQYKFLGAILESQPQSLNGSPSTVRAFHDTYKNLYVSLMCKHDVSHVADFVALLAPGELSLDVVLPSMEANGALDAAVIVLTQNGLKQEAMQRLLSYLDNLRTTLVGLLGSGLVMSDVHTSEDEISRVVDTIQKYVKVGIWLCQHASGAADRTRSSQGGRTNTNDGSTMEMTLSTAESLWLELIDSVVRVSQVATGGGDLQRNVDPRLTISTNEALRQAVQNAFTGLLAVTSRTVTAPTLRPPSPIEVRSAPLSELQPVRFLPVLEAFMTRLARRSSSMSTVRSVLTAIFSTYIFESSMLSLANALLDKDVFIHVAEAEKKRRLGWRPKGQLCEGCKRRAWGPSTGSVAWNAWRLRNGMYEGRRSRHTSSNSMNVYERKVVRAKGGGKGKDRNDTTEVVQHDEQNDNEGDVSSDALLVFSCTHVFHRKCLEGVATEPSEPDGCSTLLISCPLCQ